LGKEISEGTKREYWMRSKQEWTSASPEIPVLLGSILNTTEVGCYSWVCVECCAES
jgi:hypothetical protein